MLGLDCGTESTDFGWVAHAYWMRGASRILGVRRRAERGVERRDVGRSWLNDLRVSPTRFRQRRISNFALSRRGRVLVAPLTGVVLVAVSRIVSLGAGMPPARQKAVRHHSCAGGC
jgi:hypothetical protein